MGPTMSASTVALVVEDDEAVRDLATAVLEETDFDVIACESAEAAMSVMERPDLTVALLFSDVRLSGPMDGVSLAETVGRRWPETRVIVTSGYDTGRDRRLPADAVFMRKPWRPIDVLLQAERAAVDARAA